MGTRAPQGLLLLLLLRLLLPRGTSAGSLHNPGLSECFQVNGADYRGHQNRTGPRGAGRPCLYWDQTQQHSYSSASDPHGRWGLGAHNFCRNPDGDVQPWCYVAETEEGIYWRYCDIPTCHMPGYLGCFVDSGAPPALSGPSGTSTKLTVQLAGVEAGYACFCGSESDLARGRPAPATDCDQICFGHPGQLCGGDGRLGIYEVSVGSCQGNWTAPQGVIYSPDFPDEYGPDRNCSWALGPPGAALELTFRLFELADQRDQLELRDAASGSLLRAFDGARPPPPGPLRLRSVALLLTFRSDARGHAQGFALTYRGLQDADDPAPPKGSAQTPAGPPDGANVSCSPRPGTPEAAIGGETGVGGGREFGEQTLPALSSPHSCARSPGLLDGDGRLSAAAAAAVPAAPAARTVRALGQDLRADLAGSLTPHPGAPGRGGPWWEARAHDGNRAGRNSWVRGTRITRSRDAWDHKRSKVLEVRLVGGSADVCSLSRSCLLAPGKGPPALGPSRDPARSWAVWYRRPRGVALPCPPGDPQVESLTASYRPLSASSQSSLRSLISAL
ncbi:kremen protein 2 isoform X2 [Orcinus orca]|uniref:kremen protein 2 isoform X4 n=1 Tax=Sagmatias obliquidens TaxID=3371155 RepID=UPI000F43F129|nr:kremen protein 2 isoform X4 [Lagenorhynchus obliquidens]XP_033284922.1 kremen protein 2 isoform X2 [Orcinus orca]